MRRLFFDFAKDHEELYDQKNDHFKDKAKKECLTERFANSCNLSVKVRKTLFESQRTHHTIRVWINPEREDRTSECDTG